MGSGAYLEPRSRMHWSSGASSLQDGDLDRGQQQLRVVAVLLGNVVPPPAEFATAYRFLGDARLAQGRSDEAIEALSMASKCAPSDAETRRHLGLALQQAGRLEEA